MTTTSSDIIYTKSEYREAKKFLSGAEVVRCFATPNYTTTLYKKDGVLYYESESHLEFPENQYTVSLYRRS